MLLLVRAPYSLVHGSDTPRLARSSTPPRRTRGLEPVLWKLGTSLRPRWLPRRGRGQRTPRRGRGGISSGVADRRLGTAQRTDLRRGASESPPGRPPCPPGPESHRAGSTDPERFRSRGGPIPFGRARGTRVDLPRRRGDGEAQRGRERVVRGESSTPSPTRGRRGRRAFLRGRTPRRSQPRSRNPRGAGRRGRKSRSVL